MPNLSYLWKEDAKRTLAESQETRRFPQIPPPTREDEKRFLTQFDTTTYPRRELRAKTIPDLWGDIYNDGLMEKSQQMLLDMAMAHLKELDVNLQEGVSTVELEQRLAKTRTDLMNVCSVFQDRPVKFATEIARVEDLHAASKEIFKVWLCRALVGLGVTISASFLNNPELLSSPNDSVALLILQALGLGFYFKSSGDRDKKRKFLRDRYNYSDETEEKRELFQSFIKMSNLLSRICSKMRQESSIYAMRKFITESQQELLKLGAK